MTKLIFRNLIILVLLQSGLFAYDAVGQNQIKIDSSDVLMGKRQGDAIINYLVGNVIMSQAKTTIFCDSAIYYKNDNELEAFGNVKIIDNKDSVTITSDKLTFEGDTKLALFRENVVYQDDSVILHTNHLDYDMINSSAKYFNGGKVRDGVNILTSERGFYDTEANMVTFKDHVVVDNPNYLLEAEDLVYNIVTKIATINSPNTITRADGVVLHAMIGSEFNTNQHTYNFYVAEIESDSYIIRGDKMFHNELLKFYRVTGNVKMISKKDSVILTGDEAKYYKLAGITYIYGDPVMKKKVQKDTMYMTADTLISIENENKEKERLLAYPNVKLYKNGLQGKSDSLAYHLADSLIRFYDDPIMWNYETQITADTIDVAIKNNTIDKMYTKYNSFIISEDSIENHNQIKGRMMTAYFVGSFLKIVDVNGNGESIYYALDDENKSLTGMNKIICSDMQIRLFNNQVDNITFYTKPEGDFIPPIELKESERQLKGFEWRIEEKPELWEILHMSKEEFSQKYSKTKMPMLNKEEIPVTQGEINKIEKEIPEEKVDEKLD